MSSFWRRIGRYVPFDLLSRSVLFHDGMQLCLYCVLGRSDGGGGITYLTLCIDLFNATYLILFNAT